MDRINSIDPYANHIMSEPLANRSNSSGSSDRKAAMIALIQQTRSLSSLPLSAGDELTLAVATWMTALEEIPDHLLAASWRKATKDHDWSKAFPVMACIPAYKALLADDNARREKDRIANKYRADGTHACHYCEDSGYASIMTYCATWNDWRPVAHPCTCSATPLNQRGRQHVANDYQKNDYGQWVPVDHASSPKCHCAFCNRKKGDN